MSLFKKKRYVKCKPTEDGTGIRCISYEPTKEGDKKVVAVAEFNKAPDGSIDTLSHDGDVEEIENLTRHALKYIKRGKASGDF